MELAITIVIWIAAALLAYSVAVKKGRDPAVAIAMGLLFGFFALVYYVFAKGSKEYEIRRAKEIIKNTRQINITHLSSKDRKESVEDTAIAPRGIIILIIVIAIIIGALVLGAAASNNSSDTPSNQIYPKYQNSDNNSVSYTTPQQPASKKYPEITRITSVASCMKLGGNKRYCECALEYWEANYTLEEYAGMQEELKNNKIPSGLYKAATVCQSYK